MVITQLLGGLGNQLFQYSLGRCLAQKNRTSLKLDTSAFVDYPSRAYALEHFAVQADVLTNEQLREMGIVGPGKNRFDRVFTRIFGKPRIPVVKERAFEFDPEVLTTRAPCYLKGYWQSQKYFQPIEELIRSELRVKDPLSGENQKMADQIASSVAVSLHVRRGDYVTDAVTSRYHGTCSPQYYRAAEELMRDRLGPLTLYVFSDDPAWAEDNLRFPSQAVFAKHNGMARDYEDFRLLTMCQHHIIANSSFSWWGAWLSQNPNKLVIAPKNWFRDARHRTDDLIPPEWIRI